MIKKARFKKQFWDLITVFSNWFDVGELKKCDMWWEGVKMIHNF